MILQLRTVKFIWMLFLIKLKSYEAKILDIDMVPGKVIPSSFVNKMVDLNNMITSKSK